MGAKSVCRDVLAIDPDNQQVRIALILTLTDQFSEGLRGYNEVRELASLLDDAYERAYYSGVIRERRGLAHLRRGTPGSGTIVYELLREALDCYEEADGLEPAGRDDAKLRWNTCARVINEHDSVKPPEQSVAPIELE